MKESTMGEFNILDPYLLVLAHTFAAELKTLVHTTTKNFEKSLRPQLCRHFKIGSMSPVMAYQYLCMALSAETVHIKEDPVLWGEKKDAGAVRWSIDHLLRLDGNTNKTFRRRMDVFQGLGSEASMDTIRRPHGPEFDLLLLLGKVLALHYTPEEARAVLEGSSSEGEETA